MSVRTSTTAEGPSHEDHVATVATRSTVRRARDRRRRRSSRPPMPIRCPTDRTPAFGSVWREARVGDTVCVTPAVRTRTAQANQPSRRSSADDPERSFGRVRGHRSRRGRSASTPTRRAPLVADHTSLPFSRTMNVGSDVQLLQVVAIGRDTPGPGCRIILDGKVVAEEPVGGNAHCIFTSTDRG